MPELSRHDEALKRAQGQHLRIVQQQELIRVLEQAGQKTLLPEAYRLLSAMMRTHTVLSEEVRKAVRRPEND